MTVTQPPPTATRPGGGQITQPTPPLSRQNPPAHRTSTPQLLRIFQGVVLVVGLLIGIFGVPLASSSDGLVRQSAIETQYERVSAISAGVLLANEAGLSTLVTRTADPQPFRTQMQEVALLVVQAAEVLDTDAQTERLGSVNVAVQGYSRTMEQAIATLKADPKQTTQVASLVGTTQRTLDEQVLAELAQLQQEASSQDQFVPSQVAAAFRIVAGLGALAVIAVMVLTARRTRRVINIGLAVSLLLVLGAVGLSSLVPTTAASDASATAVRSLTTGREQLLRARAHELNMVLEPTNSTHESSWAATSRTATESFAAGGLEVKAEMNTYSARHQTLVTKVKEGKQDEIGKAATDSGASAAVVERKADERISYDQTQIGSILAGGTTGVTMISFGLGLLGLAAAIAGLIGLHQRSREYR